MPPTPSAPRKYHLFPLSPAFIVPRCPGRCPHQRKSYLNVRLTPQLEHCLDISPCLIISFDCNDTPTQQRILQLGMTSVQLVSTTLCLDAGASMSFHIQKVDHG
ncbi:hypothetical protein P691DRAFT_678263 [Macrolepiota fuliginosa MF-IS2]|uniref:Uncharacterized protein n=1 Tax=Macrolepiota fuliginosa MF-IS2 TaxID=1400762 RepID=A0A9P5X478_9AGAR|nr:hypothetical protein P691DRAFT_678263 [Macrolepiota fuliginosa MF-IS2]